MDMTEAHDVRPIIGDNQARPRVQLGADKSPQDQGGQPVQAILKINEVERQVARQRRWVRTLTLLVFCALTYLSWGAFTGGNMTFSFSEAYHPDASIDITVTSCDVVFMPGAEARMTYTARAYLAALLSELWIKTGDYVDSVYALNKNQYGCGEPYSSGSCAGLCSLTVLVPPGATAQFRVFQTPDDVGKGEPLVSVARGTSFGTLTVGEWWQLPPTLDVLVEG